MPPSLQRTALKAYAGLPSTSGATTGNLKAATDAVTSAASSAAGAASSAANTVAERMRANGWYGVSSSPPGEDLQSDDDRPPSPDPRHGKATTYRKDSTSSEGTSSTGGEGWKIWQGAYDRVKWQTVGDKVKDAAAAVKKKIGTNDGLYDSDEEDFNGPGDSHLTRIMKEYYIDTSRSTSDLPRWLFPEVGGYSPTKAWEDAPVRPSYSTRTSSRTRNPSSSSSSGSVDYSPRREYRVQRESHEDRYAERAYRSSVPTTRSVLSPGSSPATPSRIRPNEHGSRTAEKLARMKATRNV